MIGAAITHARRGETQNSIFNVVLFAMAAACVRGLPAVFYVTTRPWIRLDAALADGRAILCGWGETAERAVLRRFRALRARADPESVKPWRRGIIPPRNSLTRQASAAKG